MILVKLVRTFLNSYCSTFTWATRVHDPFLGYVNIELDEHHIQHHLSRAQLQDSPSNKAEATVVGSREGLARANGQEQLSISRSSILSQEL
jgi:hypothetical protein